MIKRLWTNRFIIITLGGGLVSCDQNIAKKIPPPDPISIVAASSSNSIFRGQSTNFSVLLPTTNLSSQNITAKIRWSFLPPDGATTGKLMDRTQEIIVLKAGKLTLIAQYKNQQTQLTLDVIERIIEHISFDTRKLNLTPQQTVPLKLTAHYLGGMTESINSDIEWEYPQTSHSINIIKNTGSHPGYQLNTIEPDAFTLTAIYRSVQADIQINIISNTSPKRIAKNITQPTIQPVNKLTTPIVRRVNPSPQPTLKVHPSPQSPVLAKIASPLTIHPKTINPVTTPLNVNPATEQSLKKMILSPSRATLTLREHQTFTLKGTDADNTEIANINKQITCISSHPKIFKFDQRCTGTALAYGKTTIKVHHKTAPLTTYSSSIQVFEMRKIGHLNERGFGAFKSIIPGLEKPEFKKPGGKNSKMIYTINNARPGKLYTIKMSTSDTTSTATLHIAANTQFYEHPCSQIQTAGKAAYCSIQTTSSTIFLMVTDITHEYAANFSVRDGGSVYSGAFVVNTRDDGIPYFIRGGIIDALYTFKLKSLNHSQTFYKKIKLLINQEETLRDINELTCSNHWPEQRASVACMALAKANTSTTVLIEPSHPTNDVAKFWLDIKPGVFSNDGTPQRGKNLRFNKIYKGQVIANSLIDNKSYYQIVNLRPNTTYQVMLLNASELVTFNAYQQGANAGSCQYPDQNVSLEKIPTTMSCRITTNHQTGFNIIVTSFNEHREIYQAASKGGVQYEILVKADES